MKDNIYLILIKIKLNTKIALLKIVYHVIIIMEPVKNEKEFFEPVLNNGKILECKIICNLAKGINAKFVIWKNAEVSIQDIN